MSGKGRVFTGDDGRPARMIGVGMDITERKRAEQDARFLADASATLAGLVDYGSTLQKVARLAVPHFADWAAVDMLDEGGALRRLAVAHVDPAKVELAHELHRRFPADPSAPQGAWNVIRSGRPEIIPEVSDDLLAATVKDAGLLRILRELGLRSYMGVPLSVRGKVLGVITFIAAETGRRYDAGDLAVAEDLAHRAAVAIENARLYQEVREADRRKDEFLAILGHELRNPLAPISNALHVLKLPAASGRVVEQAREMMERQVQHMVRLVDDLLDVSRIVRGKVELRKEPVELSTVVARAIETSQPLVEAEGHELTVALPPEPLRVSGDLVRLAQVVGNLLNNAARYTERGGRIRVECERVADRAVLRVRDTGVGIAPEALPRIWDMFVQAERRTKGSHGGMGIGLALVKGLVDLHGGTVEARSEGPGKGSEFAVTLPLLPPREPDGRLGPRGQPRQVASRRVLVVDDNVDAAESLALLLRLGGHEARVAHDGPSALMLAEAEPPEVAFLDIGMPGMDGYELARRLREQPALRGVLLVALTGWGQDEDRRRTREAGFDAHEVKPVSPEALEELLSKAADDAR
jgi:signal transduction histidine kinase